MKDPRLTKLAHTLVNYSINLKRGEKVLIQMNGQGAEALVAALIQTVQEAGGIPFFNQENDRILRELLKQPSQEQMKIMAEADRLRMSRMDAYIGIGCSDNPSETSDVKTEHMQLYMEHYMGPVHFKERVVNTKWVVLRYPTSSMAQSAGRSLEDFENFYFDVCNLDYGKMSRAMDNLAALMNRTDRVRLKGPGTDLRFSIKGIPSIKCDGKMNIPDGEVYTAPVKDSVEGHISYNCPSLYQGFTYDHVAFRFEKGRIAEARANDNKKINKLLDSDEGARYVGEFAIGVNPYILSPMKNILFDEKIMGSFHFTPGNAYDDADNGNRSAVHWDLVCIQTPEAGGGEIWFDDVLIRKDGLFVLEELTALNPENLR